MYFGRQIKNQFNRQIKKILWCGLLAALAVGCKSKQDSYVLSVALPLTGDVAAMGQGMKRGIELAVAEANKSGKFPKLIKAAFFDDRADPKEAVNVANQIVSNPATFAVVGHLNSGCSIPSAQVYAKNNLLMVSPAATNPKLTLQQMEPSWKWPRNVFRVNATDDVQGKFAANFVRHQLHLEKACIVHDKTPYGQGLAEEFQKEFLALGGKTISFDGIAVGDKDFKALLTRLQSLKPDVLYFGGTYNEGGLVVRQARQMNFAATYVSGDGDQSPEYLKIAGADAEGSYITNVGVPLEQLPSAQQFLDQYKQTYPNVDFQPYDHYAYEAAMLAITALEKAGMQDDGTVNRP